MKHITINNIISSAEAMEAALDYVSENKNDLSYSSIVCHEGLYEICFGTTFMDYELYVDANSGEVLGVESVPTEPCTWLDERREAPAA